MNEASVSRWVVTCPSLSQEPSRWGNPYGTTIANMCMTLTRFWGVGEEKFGTMDTGGFNGQISTKLYKRIQAASCGVI